MKIFSENINEFLEENQIYQVDVFGFSMGGYVALEHAIRYPNQLCKIITLETKFDWTPESANREVSQLNPELIELKVPRFARQLPDEHAPLDWKEVVLKTADMMLGFGNGQAIPEDKFAEISQKALICRGSDDTMVSEDESQNVVNLLGDSAYLELEKTPHPIEKVDDTKLASVIVNF